jgi:uncharacterized Zn-finger protein
MCDLPATIAVRPGSSALDPGAQFGHNGASPAKGRLMTLNAPETRIVDRYRIACDGGEGALGHPRVWLQIPEDKGWVECGYCDCKYVHKDHAEKA